jgi:DNA uptake protein ComE-like DNA-binding protein
MGYEDDGKQKEIDNLKAENERLKREVAYGKEGILPRATEVQKYRKLYDKAVDQIADMTLAADVAKRIAEKTAVVEKSAEVVEEKVVDPVEEFGTVDEEIPEEPPVVEKPQPKMTFPTWEPPVEKPTEKKPVKKVNVNEATQNELMSLGFSKSAAGRITNHVKMYGPYKKVDDLKKVDDVPAKLIRKLKDVLEV